MKQINFEDSMVAAPHFRAEILISHWKPHGSFILAQNNFVRSFAPITVSADAKALNNVGGSGWVRDLQEAATQNPGLVGLCVFAKSTTVALSISSSIVNNIWQ
jgi:hypothetical protein